MKDNMIYSGHWISIWKDWTLAFELRRCGYFDNRWNLSISLLGLHFLIRLPFKNSDDDRWANECDSPWWGFRIYASRLFIGLGGQGNMRGNKCKAYRIPFFYLEHYKNWIKIVTGEFVEEEELIDNNRAHYQTYTDNPLIAKKQAEYIDSYDNEKVVATFWEERREWRRYGLMWCKLFNLTRHYIEVEFNKEVGSMKGSWKGGCLACNYNMLPGESAYDTLKRMERERKFN